ncbi:MAG TPA: carbohydrate porin [Chthoniobacterales bacterium]
MNKSLAQLLILLTFSASVAVAQSDHAFDQWWTGERGTGEWFGKRPTLEGSGINFTIKWTGTYYGIASGGLEQGSSFDQSLNFDLKLDLAKLTGRESLDGFTITSGVRYRDGANVNDDVGASSTFNPSTFQSGKQWRLMPFLLNYTTPELFGVKDLLSISAGWANPYDVFAQQADSKLFRNNAIISSKGISANGVGWSSGYVAWGGHLKVKPSSLYYAQAGLYMAIPNANATSSHGVDFRGAENNGLYVLAETGLTPKVGSDLLPGKYAIGGYYWDLENTSPTGRTYDGRYGFYLQADQMLWRESSPDIVADPRATAATKRKVNDEGLRWFSFFNFAPEGNSALPFYFHTGLIYKGLIPGRNNDQFGVAYARGNYRRYEGTLKTHEGVIECDYRFRINQWSYVQPYIQYIIRPNGTGAVNDATVVGLNFGFEL